MTRATIRLVDQLERALGPAVCTPEWISAGGGRLERAGYRVWRWCCPCCWAGKGDPMYRPLVVDSDGHVFAHCCRPTPEKLAAEIRVLLDLADLLDSIDAGVVAR